MFSISSGTRNRRKRDFKYNIDENLERQVGKLPKEFWKLLLLGNCPRFAVLGILLYYFSIEVTFWFFRVVIPQFAKRNEMS